VALFQGLSAFPISPADADGQIDKAALARVLERLAVAEVDSVGLLGSAGSYVYLSRDQRRQAVETAAEVLTGKTPLMVGVGAFRTSDAVALAKDANAAGADAVLLAPVSYVSLSQDEVFQHIKTVSEATDLPLCIYNNPGATHFTFGDELLSKLAHLPNIQAVKMPSPLKEDVPEELNRLRRRMPSDFKIGYSWDMRSADAVALGGEAWYSGMAGILPQQVLKLCRAAQAQDFAETDRMNAIFKPLWDLCTKLGTVRVLYGIANGTGLFDGQAPLPVSPLSQTEAEEVMQAVSSLSAL
jgi:4-hydroxy-tetrahydrodipicolinate synthase